MHELEFMMIMGITVFLPIIILALTLRHKRWKIKNEIQHGLSDDNSLRLSELKNMIQDAVKESNAPLLERINRLEKRQKRLLNSKADPEFGLLDSMEEREAPVLGDSRRRSKTA